MSHPQRIPSYFALVKVRMKTSRNWVDAQRLRLENAVNEFADIVCRITRMVDECRDLFDDSEVESEIGEAKV